jgi:hypothetical protein
MARFARVEVRDIELHVPDAVASVEHDANTFFATDLPALLAWRIGAEDARRITQPVLYVGGTANGHWFMACRTGRAYPL